jgi:hypothetical protein
MSHVSVVVKHGHAVGGDPHVAFEARGSKFETQRERLNCVFGGVRLAAAMRKRNRMFEQ